MGGLPDMARPTLSRSMAGPPDSERGLVNDARRHRRKDTMLKLFRASAAAVAATSVGLILTAAAPAGAASSGARLSGQAATHNVGAAPFANAQNTGFAG